MEDTTNGGALRSIFGLGAKQKLQVIKMVEDKVEKSENRVLAAIAELKSDLKSEIGAVKADLRSDVGVVNGRVDSLKTTIIGTFATVIVAQGSLVFWVLYLLSKTP